MKALVSLALLLTASCASLLRQEDLDTEILYGRIVSMPEADIWLGHVMSDEPVYEVALSGYRNRRIGIMGSSRASCPYNGRPREQLFRIEIYVSNEVIFGGAENTVLPRYMHTRYRALRCDLADGPPPGRAPAAR